MASAEKPLAGSSAAIVCTLASTATANCRTGTEVDNTTNRYRSVVVSVSIKSQGTPAANTGVLEIWGLRNNNDGTPIRDGGYADDTAYTLALRPRGGSLIMILPADGSATPTLKGSGRFRNPGKKWNVLIINSLGQTLDVTGGNHVVSYYGENPELQ